jgi:predicted nuclease of predicted toxin-antitoxin system
MLPLFIDQNFNQIILRGLRSRIPALDAITAHEAELSEATDPELLAWAASNGRIIVTHDHHTMPDHVADRIAAGEKVAGVVIVSRKLPFARVIDDLEIIVMCSSEDEWENVVRHLPL